MFVSKINSANNGIQQNFNSSVVATRITISNNKPNEVTNNLNTNFSFRILKRKLTNENYFQKLYEPDSIKTTEDKYTAKLLSNPIVAKQLFQDKDVMKASTSALMKVTEKQLNVALAQKDKNKAEKLALVYSVLSSSLDSLNNQNTLKSEKYDNNEFKQVAFAGIFNYGIFDENITKSDKAEAIVNRYASLAAATSATLAQEPGIGIETLTLTYLTKTMIKKIFKLYNRGGHLLGAVTGVAAGHYLGINAAKKALVIYPGAGNAANATITYALHQLTGRAFIKYCENVPKEFDETASSADVASRFGLYVKNGLTAMKSEPIRNALGNLVEIIL